MNPIDQLITQAGTATRLAAILGVSKQTITNWRDRGTAVEQCPRVEQITGYPVEQLRPDLTWLRIPTPGWPQGRPIHDPHAKDSK